MKTKFDFKLEPFIFLYITERCQLRCRHCYMGDRLYHPKEMSYEQIEEILKYFKTLGHYKLYLLGGEPLLHSKIKEIVILANKMGYEVVLTSNGQFDKKVFDEFTPDMIHSFSFSFDSSDEATFDKIRGKGSFKKLVQNVKDAQKKGFQVRLICTVSKINLGNSLNLIDFASKELGVDMLSYHYFSPIGLGRDRVDELISPKEWMEFCNNIENYPIPENFWVYYPPTYIDSDKLPDFANRGYKGCTGRWMERVAVLPSGQVYVCSVFFDSNKNFAKWEDGYLKIRDSKDTEMENIYKINKNCLYCPSHKFCFGGCGAMRDLGGNFPGVITSKNCDRKIIPLCPLWTTYASKSKPPENLQELR